ncbi:MAG: DUF5668 domain-containing protein [Vicinamibacterales bacterium]
METMHETKTVDNSSQDGSRSGQVFIGLALMLLGLGFLFDRMDLWHVHLSRHFWPFFPLFIGLARLFGGPRSSSHGPPGRGGIGMISVGIWGLVSEFHLFRLDYNTSWPLLVIAAGLNMVWRSFEPARPRRIQEN